MPNELNHEVGAPVEVPDAGLHGWRADKRDAARYRWLRNGLSADNGANEYMTGLPFTVSVCVLPGLNDDRAATYPIVATALDAAIDAAMDKELVMEPLNQGARDAADLERYRWLRAHSRLDTFEAALYFGAEHEDCGFGVELDSAIDAALGATGSQDSATESAGARG